MCCVSEAHHQIEITGKEKNLADTSGFTGSFQDEGTCYWQNEHIEVHVYIRNITADLNVCVCVCA